MNTERSNVILFPSWFAGTTNDYITFGMIGPGELADTSKYYVIAADALGNGISSSPSNSEHFPDITIADMVRSQYLLLTQHLGISQVYAVMGVSMGGMQAFEWALQYPHFMQKVVSISGTPRQTAYDILLWKTQLLVLQKFPAADAEDIIRLIAGINALNLTTPNYLTASTPASDFGSLLARSIDSVREFGLTNREAQIKALIRHDISLGYRGSLQAAAAGIDAAMLIAVSPGDHMVNPLPSKEFAALAGAQYLELDQACGHIAATCDRQRLRQAVHRFLKQLD